jgi:hypothetical protein
LASGAICLPNPHKTFLVGYQIPAARHITWSGRKKDKKGKKKPVVQSREKKRPSERQDIMMRPTPTTQDADNKTTN